MGESTTQAEPTNAPAASPASAPAKGWSEADTSAPLPFWASVREDVVNNFWPEQRDRRGVRWALKSVRRGLTSPGFKATFLYRVNHSLVHRTGRPGKVAAGVINFVAHHLYFSAISPEARLYGGLVLPHPQGIIIGSGVVVGPRTWIFQNVTMGSAAGNNGEPTVGAECGIYAGAVICGPITVGDGVVVCPNSLVQRSVPPRNMAVGVPANVFPRFAKPKV